MKSIDDVLQRRAGDFNLEKGDQLVVIQEVLNKRYIGRVRAKKLKDGVLSITTPSSAVANDLRLDQIKLIKQLNEFEVSEIKILIN